MHAFTKNTGCVDGDAVGNGYDLYYSHKDPWYTAVEQHSTLTCTLCSMEERVHKKVADTTTTNRSYSRQKKFLVMCNHPNCHIVAHLQCPVELNKREIIPEMIVMKSCFAIAHSEVRHGLFYPVAHENQKKFETTQPPSCDGNIA